MMFLRGLIITLIAVIGVTNSRDLNLREPRDSIEYIDLEYRPWDQNDTATSWISLDGMGLSTINSVLQLNVHDLRLLVMDNNNIERIPSESFKFSPNLTYVSLANNKISEFANGAFNHIENLQILDLDENPINKDLDGCRIFSALPALRRLYLRNCGLLSFDLDNCMENLSHLHLSKNRIQAFFAKSKSAVTHLYLNDNQLRYVLLSQFESLVYLNVSNNWFREILPGFYHARLYSSAKDYRRLNYYYEYQYSISISGLNLYDAPALRYLIISSNHISNIEPDTFLRTERLIHVDLSNNEIREIQHGAFSNLLYLEQILLDSNKITKIHFRAFVNLPRLKIISLKNNQITDLSEDAFTKLNSNAPDLHLYLDNNRIHTLKRGSFMGINGLKHIGLSKNRIKTISSKSFVNLPNLESVLIENQSRDEDVDQSPWNRPVKKTGIIKSDAFFNLSNLTSITIRGNLFAAIEAQAFHTLPALKMLDLSNNSIKFLASTAFNDLPKLEDLYLENNLISNIGPNIFPEQLKHLNLAKNPLCEEFSCWHIGELYQLEKLNVSGIIEQFKITDVSALPENLTVVVGK